LIIQSDANVLIKLNFSDSCLFTYSNSIRTKLVLPQAVKILNWKHYL